MEGIKANEVERVTLSENFISSQKDFAIELLKKSYLQKQNQNTLISPLSIVVALAMVANGADGETKEQMLKVLGNSLTMEELNHNLYSYVTSLPSDDKQKLNVANSIWLKEDPLFSVEEAFLQTNADYYKASAYYAPFNNQTVKDINNWVKNKTDRMIDKVIDKIPEETIAYLVNALLFEGAWTRTYERSQVSNGTFTAINGEKKSVKMMKSSEYGFVQTTNATGVVKPYKGNAYSFVALLPNESIEFNSFIESLNSKEVANAIKNRYSNTVITKIPKFEYDYSIELKEILVDMGMGLAFNPNFANFSKLGHYENGNIFIGNVLHKTSIKVAEKGTKAGAVTVISMDKATSVEPGEIKYVYLDRPFVYMIINNESSLPIFIGCVTNIN